MLFIRNFRDNMVKQNIIPIRLCFESVLGDTIYYRLVINEQLRIKIKNV